MKAPNHWPLPGPLDVDMVTTDDLAMAHHAMSNWPPSLVAYAVGAPRVPADEGWNMRKHLDLLELLSANPPWLPGQDYGPGWRQAPDLERQYLGAVTARAICVLPELVRAELLSRGALALDARTGPVRSVAAELRWRSVEVRLFVQRRVEFSAGRAAHVCRWLAELSTASRQHGQANKSDGR